MKKVKDSSLSVQNILSLKTWLLCSLIYCLVGQQTYQVSCHNMPIMNVFFFFSSPFSVRDKSENLAFSEDNSQFLNIVLIVSDSALEMLYLPT